jgi:hypothetical protein
VVYAAQMHVISVSDRVRARVQVRGTIGPVEESAHEALFRNADDKALLSDLLESHTVLRIEPGQVLVDGHQISLKAYRTARPDRRFPAWSTGSRRFTTSCGGWSAWPTRWTAHSQP